MLQISFLTYLFHFNIEICERIFFVHFSEISSSRDLEVVILLMNQKPSAIVGTVTAFRKRESLLTK